MNKKRGWYREPIRHGLAAQGVETTEEGSEPNELDEIHKEVLEDSEVPMEDWVEVHICLDENDLTLDEVFELQEDLYDDTGIRFDTVFGGDVRTWQLDWSIRNGTPEEVMEWLDERGIEYQKEDASW